VAAAEWVESLGRSEDHAGLIAHHYGAALEFARAAGQPVDELVDRARIAFREAGDRAATLSAWDVAAAFHRSAFELWPDDAERPRLLFALGRAEWTDGDASAGRLYEAIDALLAAGDAEAAGEAEALVAEAAWYRGDAEELERGLRHALELVDPLPPSPAKATILSQASRYSMLAAEYESAIEHGTRALAMAEALDLPAVRAHALNNLGSARERIGAGGLEELEESVALAEEINSPELARALNNLASCLYSAGRVGECIELEERSLAAGQRFGLESLVLFERSNILGSLIRLGRWDEASARADALIADNPPEGIEAHARTFRAWIRVARDDLEGALEDSAFGMEVALRIDEPQSVVPTYSTRAYVLDAVGDTDEARRLVLQALERLEPLRAAGNVAPPLPAEMLDSRVRAIGRELTLESLAGWRFESPWVIAGRALVDGRFDDAIRVYEEIGSKADLALTHLRAAEACVAQGARADADPHLHAALSFYRSVGARRYVRQASDLLAATA
jgi:tetratricopeptide (TPR) repeat protein